jgi:hypothetical protein
MLKLLPSMLSRLGLKQNTVYYACSEEWELNAVKEGKRRRWTADAQLKVDTEDLDSLKYQKNIEADHTYTTDEPEEGEKVESVKMGQDFFMDTDELTLKEETVEDEVAGEEAGYAACSQESSAGLFDSGEEDSDDDYEVKQASQESCSQDTSLGG